jgi:hypothetical protein
VFKASVNSVADGTDLPLSSYLNLQKIDTINITFDKSKMIKVDDKNKKLTNFPQDEYIITLMCVSSKTEYNREIKMYPNSTFTLWGNGRLRSLEVIFDGVAVPPSPEPAQKANEDIGKVSFSSSSSNSLQIVGIESNGYGYGYGGGTAICDSHSHSQSSHSLSFLSQSEIDSSIDLRLTMSYLTLNKTPEHKFVVIMKLIRYFYRGVDVTENIDDLLSMEKIF